jgi:hypothetical protein
VSSNLFTISAFSLREGRSVLVLKEAWKNIRPKRKRLAARNIIKRFDLLIDIQNRFLTSHGDYITPLPPPLT